MYGSNGDPVRSLIQWHSVLSVLIDVLMMCDACVCVMCVMGELGISDGLGCLGSRAVRSKADDHRAVDLVAKHA